MRFYVGQKVVCVDDTSIEGTPSRLKNGAVYTVLSITRDRDYNGTFGVKVAEVIDPPVAGYRDAYRRTRFRPAVTRSTETGMAILRGLLDTSPVSLNEEVG